MHIAHSKKIRTAIITLGSFLVVTTIVGAWTSPSSAPPDGNVPPPINQSNTDQVKEGGLGVGNLTVGGGSEFTGMSRFKSAVYIGDITTSNSICLNGSCITSWPSGGGSSGGSATLECRSVSSPWDSSLSYGDRVQVTGPAGFYGVNCDGHYYDTNSGVLYHGYTPGNFSADRRTCFWNVGDSGISEGSATGDFCRIVDGSGGSSGGGGGGDNLGNHTATRNIDMDRSQVTDLGAPVNGTDAATKAYVDGRSPVTYSGFAEVGFVNGQPHSNIVNVTFPSTCNNPVVVTQSQSDSIACGTGSGPGICQNSPGTNSEDLKSYASNVTSTGFRAYLSSMSGVWVGAVSPRYRISWIATCN